MNRNFASVGAIVAAVALFSLKDLLDFSANDSPPEKSDQENSKSPALSPNLRTPSGNVNTLKFLFCQEREDLDWTLSWTLIPKITDGLKPFDDITNVFGNCQASIGDVIPRIKWLWSVFFQMLVNLRVESYSKAYNEYATFLHQRYPFLSIEGGHYPPPPHKALLAQILSYFKIGLLVAIVFGFDPFNALNLATPNFYNWALQNKVYSCMMLFFVSNAIEGQLVSTGAFEIALGDIPVWSKLESGRIPSAQELVQILENMVNSKASSF